MSRAYPGPYWGGNTAGMVGLLKLFTTRKDSATDSHDFTRTDPFCQPSLSSIVLSVGFSAFPFWSELDRWVEIEW